MLFHTAEQCFAGGGGEDMLLENGTATVIRYASFVLTL